MGLIDCPLQHRLFVCRLLLYSIVKYCIANQLFTLKNYSIARFIFCAMCINVTQKKSILRIFLEDNLIQFQEISEISESLRLLVMDDNYKTLI